MIHLFPSTLGPVRALRGARFPIRPFLAGVLASSLFLESAFGQVNATSSTAGWVPLMYGDPSGDFTVGSAETDFVGNSTSASFYMQYSGGLWGFRFRLGADTNPNGFRNSVAAAGLDANSDGRIDLFVGVYNQPGLNRIDIWSPGAGLNDTPGNTTISAPPLFSYVEAANYSFMSVTAANDPTAISYDLNADGQTDQFLTFVVPFADVTSALAARGISNFTTNSFVSFVALTASAPGTTADRDIDGVTGNINSSQLWSSFGGGLTVPVPIPEPATVSLAALSAFLLLRKVRAMRF